MEHDSRRPYRTLASLKNSIGFLFLHICTEHTDLRVTLIERKAMTVSPHGFFQMSFRFIHYDTFTNQTRQRLITCDECWARDLHVFKRNVATCGRKKSTQTRLET